MAKKLTEKDVRHIAKLARIDLTGKEVDKYRKMFNETLDYVQVIKEVDTSDVEETSHTTGLENVFREDVVTPSLSQSEALSNAKEKEDGYFKVPPVLK